MKKLATIYITIMIACNFSIAQNTAKFPAETIDTTIINERGLQESVLMLVEECNWEQRIGGKIDVFWLQTQNGNFFGYSYEYFMNCDNLRLIYWYDNREGKGKPVDFMIENLEDESLYVVAKRKHLKNKKKYEHLLKDKKDD